MERWRALLVCALLALAVWLVFGQTRHFEFVNYDDGIYVVENPMVSQGLSLKGIVWAFTQFNAEEWWPLTVLSHMLACDLFGINPAAHHLINVLLHAATAMLLFLVLRSMTGAVWASAFVAAVFAVHPLRVESVAWVTERKDVLSGLFFMLTLWAYGRYASGAKCEGSGVSLDGTRDPQPARRYYWLALVFFVLGLMSKSTVITLPFVLLLLDYWPLRRIAPGDRLAAADVRLMGRLIAEKIPFFVAAIASGLFTTLAIKHVTAVRELNPIWHLGNALVSYSVYLWQLVWPTSLAVMYPHSKTNLPIEQVALSVLILSAMTAFVLAAWRKRPYLPVGWFWYLGMLVPVIGIVQVGDQAHADRYTYLPQIGLYVLAAWGAAEWCGTSRPRRLALGIATPPILIAFVLLARAQTAHWRDSISLWEHTLACTANNPIAHHQLGNALALQERLEEAIHQFHRALELEPEYAEAHNSLGKAFAAAGNPDAAIQHYQWALQFRPNFARAHNNWGNALSQKGDWREAARHYAKALELRPNSVRILYNFANALAELGRLDEAIRYYYRALQINPNHDFTHKNLTVALIRRGKLEEAIEHGVRAVQLRPDSPKTHYNLGKALILSGRTNEAIRRLQRAYDLAMAQGHGDFARFVGAQLHPNRSAAHRLQRTNIAKLPRK